MQLTFLAASSLNHVDYYSHEQNMPWSSGEKTIDLILTSRYYISVMDFNSKEIERYGSDYGQ